MTGSLVLVGTPIGNLADLSPRAAEALRSADVVACEDTRRTAPLLRHAGAVAPMVALHRHNEAARAADLVARIRAGARVALVSDAGMPLVSDPGARLVRAALDASLPVEVVPGPSAVTAALAASGLAGEGGFAFLGFAPRRAAERRRLMERPRDPRRPGRRVREPQAAAVAPRRPRRRLARAARGGVPRAHQAPRGGRARPRGRGRRAASPTRRGAR